MEGGNISQDQSRPRALLRLSRRENIPKPVSTGVENDLGPGITFYFALLPYSVSLQLQRNPDQKPDYLQLSCGCFRIASCDWLLGASGMMNKRVTRRNQRGIIFLDFRFL